MIYPIYAFGQAVLKKKATDVELNNEALQPIIKDMFETMHHCKGVGLAAPQVGLSIRLFVIDSSKVNDEDTRMDKAEEGIKEVFINAVMIEENGGLISLEEGCLSIPNIYGHVEREKTIRIRYYDANLVLQEKSYSGFTARVIQHEYDHIEGVLFIEKLKPLKKQMIKRRLEEIKKGTINVRYKMKFLGS
jgi:peptide deformylase